MWPAGTRVQLHARPDYPGYLCLYAGKRGVAKAVVKAGPLWALTFDWLHGPSQDLLKPALQDALVAAVEARTFAGVGLAPICASFSTAVTPPIRTSQFPEGIPNLSPSFLLKVQRGNAHCTFVVRLVRVLILMDLWRSLFGWRTLTRVGCGGSQASSRCRRSSRRLVFGGTTVVGLERTGASAPRCTQIPRWLAS